MSYYQSNIDSDKQTEALQIEDQIITNSSQITLLGVEMDEKLNFTSQISNICLKARLGLFEGWITLSTGQIAIQRITVNKTDHAIRWIVIYPVDSVIQPLNNRAQSNSWCFIETTTFDTIQSKTDNLQIIHPASLNILPSGIA